MSYNNRINLDCTHYTQQWGGEFVHPLDLSGCTQIYGQLVIKNNVGVGKVFTSDSGGTGTWQTLTSVQNITKQICQISHGFNVNNVLGWSGGTYNKPIADGSYDGEILGIVTKRYNANCFNLTQAGYVTGLTGMSVNTTYFLSDTVAGQLTPIKPIINGHIVKSIILADTTNSGWVLPYPSYYASSGSTVAAINEFIITGNSVSTGFTVNHALNKQFVNVEVVKNSIPYSTVFTSIERPNANCVCVLFDNPPVSGQQYKVLIIK